ncbi:peroxidase 20 [Artemisia annua]|uniref:Basic peroxidase n=1 Tax=Artemisia annua TaxID=35608 RepID=A0A2U1NM51_ARTAN|nr:peroxidase 20 [Artemisia annua]
MEDNTNEIINRSEYGGSIPVDNVQALASSKDLKDIPSHYIRPEIELDVVLTDESLQIPVIDISKLAVAGQPGYDDELENLHVACRDWGFFQIYILYLFSDSITMNNIVTLLVALLVISQTKTSLCDNEPLVLGYYEETCPLLEEIVQRQVEIAVHKEPRMAASLLRLNFHDCFVMGCNASVLLDDFEGVQSEKNAGPNLNSLRGFEVIDEIKYLVEEACPCTVSCADLLAIVARDAVALRGGPKWNVYLGRKDSMKASLDGANQLIPAPNSSLETLIANFRYQGLNIQDLVALSGSHTIGKAQCKSFRQRIYDYDDSEKNSYHHHHNDNEFQRVLKSICPKSGKDNALAPLDIATPLRFDNHYFQNIKQGLGLLISDNVLISEDIEGEIRDLVWEFASDEKKMIPGTNLHQFDVHNDGFFAHLPLRYDDGVILNMASVRMPYEKFAEFLEEKVGNYFQGLYYKVPNVELEKGLVKVSDDKQIAHMFDVAELYGRLDLYLDHLDMDLSEYLEKADTDDMDECVYRAKGPPKPRYCNKFSVDEMVNWAEMEVEYEASSSNHPRTSAEGDVPRASENVEVPMTSSEVDVATTRVDGYNVRKELIELRKRIKASRLKEPESVTEMNEPNDQNQIHTENTDSHRSETMIEHDLFMNTLMRRLQSSDENGMHQDPFVCVEKHVDRYPVYDESTHWRLRHPKKNMLTGTQLEIAKQIQGQGSTPQTALDLDDA